MKLSRFIATLEKGTAVVKTDFLIIGGGIAGLFTALKASPFGQVTVLAKKSIKESNTGLAQGGIAAAVDEEDSPFLHLEDTLEAGAGLCDIEAVQVMVREGPARIKDLITAGAQFDMRNGTIALAREAAHSKARILHVADATGEAVRVALVKSCEEKKDISIQENHFLIDLIRDWQGECVGALVYDEGNEKQIFYLARIIVLATGGGGQLYRYTTNPEVATADGMAAAFRAGCKLSDMEFVQFHPTVLFSRDTRRFLISEAVRGEGAVLYNTQGERFMARYHRLQELAPRDVVSRAILSELNLTGSEYVYLDMTSIPGVKERFPNISRTCADRGIDIERDPIPVSPAAHFIMGGIKTNSSGETGIPGLYACGETACTGVHGANRLASNSLLEGIVFGQRVIEKAVALISRPLPPEADIKNGFRFDQVHCAPTRGIDPQEAKKELRVLMWDQVGIIRDEAGLQAARQRIAAIYAKVVRGQDPVAYYEALNMLTVAGLIVEAALQRKESRGGHARSDYPQRDDVNWCRHLIFAREMIGDK